MQFRREEIRTGILVLVSIGILAGALLAIGMPGAFKATNTYKVYFDNLDGLDRGAPVLLAGRRIGQVTKLISPVPSADRPKGYENYQTLVEVEVDPSAEIYKHVQVRMLQTSLLGGPVIDFTNGDETSGLAVNGSYFVGIRAKDFTASISDVVDLIKNARQAQQTAPTPAP